MNITKSTVFAVTASTVPLISLYLKELQTEWARILSNFDVEVSIVEMAEHLVPVADIEVSKRVERIFKQKKVKQELGKSFFV